MRRHAAKFSSAIALSTDLSLANFKGARSRRQFQWQQSARRDIRERRSAWLQFQQHQYELCYSLRANLDGAVFDGADLTASLVHIEDVENNTFSHAKMTRSLDSLETVSRKSSPTTAYGSIRLAAKANVPKSSASTCHAYRWMVFHCRPPACSNPCSTALRFRVRYHYVDLSNAMHMTRPSLNRIAVASLSGTLITQMHLPIFADATAIRFSEGRVMCIAFRRSDIVNIEL